MKPSHGKKPSMMSPGDLVMCNHVMIDGMICLIVNPEDDTDDIGNLFYTAAGCIYTVIEIDDEFPWIKLLTRDGQGWAYEDFFEVVR